MATTRDDGAMTARWRPWIVGAAMLAAATLLLLSMRERLDKAHVAMVYLLVVLGASAAGGRAVGLAISGGASSPSISCSFRRTSR